MFCIKIKIEEIRILKPLPYQARFFLRMEHFHYFLSGQIQLGKDQIKVNIDHKFYAPEDKPQFQIMLLVQQGESSRKILGQASFDAKDWPIDQEKTRSIQFSDEISVKVSIANSFMTLPQFQSAQFRPQDQSSVSKIEFHQQLEQVESHYNFLKEKNLRLKEDLRQVKQTNDVLLHQRQTKRQMLQKREAQRKYLLRQKQNEVNEVKRELEQMNGLIGEIVNLIYEHGQLEICNSILDLLAAELPQQQ